MEQHLRVVNTRCCFGPTRISLSCVQNKIFTETLQSNIMQNVSLDNCVVNVFHFVACRKILESILGKNGMVTVKTSYDGNKKHKY